MCEKGKKHFFCDNCQIILCCNACIGCPDDRKCKHCKKTICPNCCDFIMNDGKPVCSNCLLTVDTKN